jgi:hypothetical protein
VGEHTEVAFSLSRGIRPTTQRTAKPSFVTRDCRLHLPSLTVDPTMPRTLRLLAESFHHLSSIRGLRPLAALASTVQRDHRRADFEVLAAIPVVRFAIEGGIGQHAVPGHGQRRLSHDRTQLWRIVGRTGGHRGSGDEVTGGIDRDGELGPETRSVAASGPLEEVSRGVAAFEARAVHGGRRRWADQAAVGCGRGGTVEEANDLPFLSSRWAA